MKTKKCAILQSNYIPWKGYFDLINSVDEFVIYDCVQYTKNDWRNRNKIKTAKGAEWLTIPVSVSNRMQTLIQDVSVANSDWRKKHWTAITQSYSKCPYFNEFKAPFEEFYLSGNETSLSEINFSLIKIVCNILGIDTRLSNATDYKLDEDRNLKLVGICEQVDAATYISGPAASCYLDVQLFATRGIEVLWQDYSNYPEYPQRFPPFEHGVTVLDLIFNVGADSRNYMKSFRQNVSAK